MEEKDVHKADIHRSNQGPEQPKKDENPTEIGATPIIKRKKVGSLEDAPQGFKDSMCRFSRIPKEEMRKIAAMGGKASAGISKKAYSKCINCEVRSSCRRAFEESHKKGWSDKYSRCVYEIEGRQQIKDKQLKEYKAFISSDPVDLLAKIQSTFKILEEVVANDPSYTKLTNLLYLLMNIYRLKFGEKAFVMSVNKNLDSNASLDIKQIMKEIRSSQIKDEAIDITPHPVSKNADEDLQ